MYVDTYIYAYQLYTHQSCTYTCVICFYLLSVESSWMNDYPVCIKNGPTWRWFKNEVRWFYYCIAGSKIKKIVIRIDGFLDRTCYRCCVHQRHSLSSTQKPLNDDFISHQDKDQIRLEIVRRFYFIKRMRIILTCLVPSVTRLFDTIIDLWLDHRQMSWKSELLFQNN